MITPDMRTYYGVAVNDTVKKMAFVFRSSDNSKEGKDAGNADIFVDVLNLELSVTFAAPAQKTLIVNKNDSVTFIVHGLLSTSLPSTALKIISTSPLYCVVMIDGTVVTTCAEIWHSINVEISSNRCFISYYIKRLLFIVRSKSGRLFSVRNNACSLRHRSISLSLPLNSTGGTF